MLSGPDSTWGLLEFCVSCPLTLGSLPSLTFVLVLTPCQMLPSFLLPKQNFLLTAYKVVFIPTKFYFASVFIVVLRINFVQLMVVLAVILSTQEAKAGGSRSLRPPAWSTEMAQWEKLLTV